MSEKKLVFVSIASPNNLTPTSEKPLLYYGLAVKIYMAPMKIPGAHYYKRSKMMLGNQSKPYQTDARLH
ncbi:hypothetical protein HID58_069382, partial [Brassica napus]